MRFLPSLSLFFSLLLPLAAAADGPPRVVASIAPLAGIAAAVMEGVGQPDLLVQGNASPHDYQLRPSDAATLTHADLVLWVGPALEGFMVKPLRTHSQPAKWITVLEQDQLLRLPARELPLWGPEPDHDHDHDHHHHAHDHNHGQYDPHVWLSPANAGKIAQLLAQRLGALDAANAETYKRNALAFTQRLQQLQDEVAKILVPLKAHTLVTFHDATQYFEQAFGLQVIGALSLSPERSPSAAHLMQLRTQLKEQQVRCVLSEPQFSPALVKRLIGESQIKTSEINPDASDLPLSPTLYEAYMRRLAAGFAACAD